jgi:hypothetical protein
MLDGASCKQVLQASFASKFCKQVLADKHERGPRQTRAEIPGLWAHLQQDF